MIKIKMCGLRREDDIEYANTLLPDYIGYVFAQKSKRYVTPEKARELTSALDSRVIPVGVFVDSPAEDVINLVECGAIQIAQLHGNENAEYISRLHDKNITVIKAFIVKSENDIELANVSTADYVLLDAGMGDGRTFNYNLLENIARPYFLAGGLSPENVSEAIKLNPFAVDVSSGIETDGFKDFVKMKKFIDTIRKD
ncbi:MAG: phosphoribosylanthranilate isomerase [Ruminococcus flavefaciens]|nr:phosphoribosylanthranilate isomerase [Ruminococcus flavefaciens]MCM1230624.1 phosphoribosylanthranilate isomerase [Ruminococcus flavefaciens]